MSGKIAIKGDRMSPEIVINYLTAMEDGKNTYNHIGDDDAAYYYVHDDGRIICTKEPPEGFQKITIQDL